MNYYRLKSGLTIRSEENLTDGELPTNLEVLISVDKNGKNKAAVEMWIEVKNFNCSSGCFEAWWQEKD